MRCSVLLPSTAQVALPAWQWPVTPAGSGQLVPGIGRETAGPLANGHREGPRSIAPGPSTRLLCFSLLSTPCCLSGAGGDIILGGGGGGPPRPLQSALPFERQ